MQSYVEHANITVTDLDQAIRFFALALPDFTVRRRWTIGDKEWAHVGTDSSYVALNTPLDKKLLTPPDTQKSVRKMTGGFNHLGFVVEDVVSVRDRLLEAGFHGGYNDGLIIEHQYRRSAYFLDGDGNEFEFMQYLTDNIADRNSYES